MARREEGLERVVAERDRLRDAIATHQDYVTVHSGMRGGAMDRELWAVLTSEAPTKEAQ